MTYRRMLFAALLGIVLIAITPTAASSQSCGYICTAAQNLPNNPVYVSPALPSDFFTRLDSREVSQIAGIINSGSVNLYIAILPDDAEREAGSADGMPKALSTAMGRGGVFAVVAGNKFRGGSSAGEGFESGEVAALVREAIAETNPRADFAETLRYFVQSVENHKSPGAAPNQGSQGFPPTQRPQGEETDGGASGWTVLLVILGLLAAVVVIGLLVWWAFRSTSSSRYSSTYDDPVYPEDRQSGSTDPDFPGPYQPRRPRSTSSGRDSSPTQTVVHNHYYEGGDYDGVYYRRGYYRDPFWEGVAVGQSMDHHHHHRDHDNDRHRSDNWSPPPAPSYTPPSHHSSGDFSSPSYDPPSSGGGGGGDWGGGSSDNSSGGGDM